MSLHITDCLLTKEGKNGIAPLQVKSSETKLEVLIGEDGIYTVRLFQNKKNTDHIMSVNKTCPIPEDVAQDYQPWMLDFAFQIDTRSRDDAIVQPVLLLSREEETVDYRPQVIACPFNPPHCTQWEVFSAYSSLYGEVCNVLTSGAISIHSTKGKVTPVERKFS